MKTLRFLGTVFFLSMGLSVAIFAALAAPSHAIQAGIVGAAISMPAVFLWPGWIGE